MQNALWELACEFCPNSSIQACIKSVGNPRKEIVFGLRKQGKIPVFSALAFASACAKFYETYMIACTAYSIS